MNINVREYLRINPISVHDLTLSESNNDCFLLFYENGYEVETQSQLFTKILKSIFGNAINESGEFDYVDNSTICENSNPMLENNVLCDETLANYDTICEFGYDSNNDDLIWWKDDNLIPANQFSSLLRKSIFDSYKTNIENILSNLEVQVSNLIQQLNEDNNLDYSGAVELMSQANELYSGFQCAIGQIWCYDGSTTMSSGNDLSQQIELIEHNHSNSKVEALTNSLTSNKNGGKVVSNGSKIGSSSSISYLNSILQTKNVSVKTINDGPLSGLNVIDFREINNKTHNNVPPSYNILVKYKPRSSSRFVKNSLMNRSIVVDDSGNFKQDLSSVEAQYQSLSVLQLEGYGKFNFTVSDLLLRIVIGKDNQPELRKQPIEIFLSVFSNWANRKLRKDTFSMVDLVQSLFTKEMVRRETYESWLISTYKRIEELRNKLELIRSLKKARKPATYVGRIIISTTDNTEKKVIEHYGGRRWKRLVNFLRGVDENSQYLNKKYGEKFVEIREQNLKFHRHDVTLESNQQLSGLQLGANGQSIVILNSTSGDNPIKGMKMSGKECQISPLTENDQQQSYAVPHDNMPPNKQVYMWECVEIEDDTTYMITYDLGDSEKGIMPSIFKDGSKVWNEYKSHDWNLPYYPGKIDDVIGYEFIGWNPRKVSYGQTGDVEFKANWKAMVYVISFDSDGGTEIPEVTREYKQAIGDIQIPEKHGYDFLGWYDEYGNKLLSSTIVLSNMRFTARWEKHTYQIIFNGNGGLPQQTTIERKYEETIGDISIGMSKVGYVFDGWYDQRTGGNEITKDTIVLGNATYYAHWKDDWITITYDSNGGEEE